MKHNKHIRLLAVLLAALCVACSVPFAAAADWGEPAETPAAPPTPTATPAPTPSPSETPGGGESTPSPTPSATPTPGETPGTSATPTPGASETPAASATPTASPTPTPAAHTVHLTAEAAQVRLGDDYNLLNGVHAVDETGAGVSVQIVDDGGFDQYTLGAYTVRYAATHPVTGQRYTLTRTVTVYKAADQLRYTITIIAPELVLQAGSSGYNLLKDAYALIETGEKGEVGLWSSNGFSTHTPGSYTVTLAARHPVTRELTKAQRAVRVLSEKDFAAYQKTQRRLNGDSNERYAKYLQYRNEIHQQLQVRMEALTADMQAHIDRLSTVFPGKKLRLVRYEPAFVDSDNLEAEQALQLSYPELSTGYTPMDVLDISNWSDILAVFVANGVLNVDKPLDLMNLRTVKFDTLGDVFWDMNKLTYHVDGEELRVMVTPLTAYEAAAIFGWDEDRMASLDELMQPEFLKVFASLTGDKSFDAMSPEAEQAIRDTLPKGLDVQREGVVLTASSLVGKLSYFWGGKYNQLGWNPLWGVPKRVTSEGSKTTDKVRNYGLDCSGFVAWAFINAVEDPSIISAIGEGSANQWAHSNPLGWEEAQPGDLAFRAKPGSVDINHVGIVAYKTDDGDYMIVHCSSKLGGVVVTEAWASGFRYLRRPALYSADKGGK
ncbi:MAG: C40 family peptidase [Christensenellaceae bacterium]|jgi:hypothetical protein|nr:C40 family peptidase [Christensenellaceae bacterium]